MQQEVGSGRLPTHAIMMTTYSIALSIPSTTPAYNWLIEKARTVTKLLHGVGCLCWRRWEKQVKKINKINLTLDQICPQLLNTAPNAFSLLVFSPTCARAHIPHAAGRAHANLLASAPHRSPCQCPCSCLHVIAAWLLLRSAGCLRRGETPASAVDRTGPRDTIQARFSPL